MSPVVTKKIQSQGIFYRRIESDCYMSYLTHILKLLTLYPSLILFYSEHISVICSCQQRIQNGLGLGSYPPPHVVRGKDGETVSSGL